MMLVYSDYTKKEKLGYSELDANMVTLTIIPSIGYLLIPFIYRQDPKRAKIYYILSSFGSMPISIIGVFLTVFAVVLSVKDYTIKNATNSDILLWGAIALGLGFSFYYIQRLIGNSILMR